MKKLILSFIVLSLAGCGTSAPAINDCPGTSLTESEVLRIASAEVTRRGGHVDSATQALEYKVTADGCDYLVMLAARPAKPGDSVVMRIDRRGVVIRFASGR